MSRTATVLLLLSLLVFPVTACSDFTVSRAADPPVADPPGSDSDEWGQPPDWTTCSQAYDGRYYNLPGDHPDLFAATTSSSGDSGGSTGDSGGSGGSGGSKAVGDPTSLDWWDPSYAAFDRTDSSLDKGGDWWPVDQGLAGDPDGWTARWLGWLRVTDSGTQQLVIGASSDLWVLVDGQVVASLTGQHVFSTQTVDVQLSTGQSQLELRFAQRGGESGLAFRPVGDGLAVCVGE